MSHRIAYGGGAATVRSVPLREGRAVAVASANYSIVDLRYSDDSAERALASGAASVDTVSTTLSAAAGRVRSITVTSATGIVVGRRYLLSSGGRSELVKVDGIDGNTLQLAAVLPSSFPSGATFRGVEIAATVPADAAADEDYIGQPVLAVRWEPAGLLPYQEQVFVERVAPAPPVTPEAVLELDPTLSSYVGQGMTVAGALAMALEDWSCDMLKAGVDDGIMGGPIAKSAIRYRAGYHLLKHSSDESAVRRTDAYGKRYDELVASVLAGRDRAKVTRTDKDGVREPPSIRSLFRAGGW